MKDIKEMLKALETPHKKQLIVSQEELVNFMTEHLSQKNELELNNIENLEDYKLGLYEGLINGIHWGHGMVDGIDFDIKDEEYHPVKPTYNDYYNEHNISNIEGD